MKTLMRRPALYALLLATVCTVQAAIQVPKTGRLAGPLNSAESAFGDEFFNFPAFYQGRAVPGKTHLSGWIEFRFSEPVGKKARFTVKFNGVGVDDGIAFPGGATYSLVRNRAFNSEAQESHGTLDLETGQVEIELNAIFVNSVVAKVNKNIRIPFGFPNSYPPIDLPIALPFADRPRVFRDAKFITDATGKITGFEFRGETIAPVTVFPQLGLFPPYAFGDQGRFYFANPTGCLPGAPAQNCPTDETNPDGVLLPRNAFFHPHFELITSELREISEQRPVPCGSPLASGGGLVSAVGRLYHLGGFDGQTVSPQVQVFDPQTNQWGQAASIPRPILSAQSAAVGSKIFLIGGWDPSTGLATNFVQTFDTRINQWTVRASLPVPVSGGAAVSLGNRVFVIGGRTYDQAGNTVLTNETQVYDSTAETWTLAARAPVATAESSAVVVGSNIYLINGRTQDGVITNQVWIYESGLNRWLSGPSTLRGVYEAGAGSIGNRVYLVGGRTAADGPVDSQRMQILELSQNKWRDGHEQPLPAAAGAAATLDGKFFIVGGRTMVGFDPPPGQITDVLQFYDPALGWSVCDSHPIFNSAGVINAASGVVGPPDLSPGSRAVILGYNLAARSAVASPIRFEDGQVTSDLPTTLEGASIRVDGKPAAIFSVSPTRVEFQTPYEVAADSGRRRLVSLDLIRQGSPKQQPPVLIPILAAAPGIFVYHYGELREREFLDRASTIARNSDGRLNHPSQPARPGETITLEVTGLGLVDPPLQSGRRAGTDPPNKVIFAPLVTIDGKTARVVSANLAPRRAGVYELKVVVPPDSSRRNSVTVQVTVNDVQSNRASISVR